MDPINNPTPNPNPTPVPTPTPGAPVPPVAPTAPVTPVAPVQPTSTPVNPVVQPGGVGMAGVPGTSGVPGVPTPVNPVYQPGQSVGVAATDPIMMPEPAPEPDPIEEELKAPMKAAAPVPGSIGSAVSMPSEGASAGATEMPAENPFMNQPKANTPSVAFNDPATQPEGNPGAPAAPAPMKKKNDKLVLIILIAVAAVVVVILAIVLIVQLTSGSSTAANNPPVVAVDDNENAPRPSGGGSEAVGAETTLSCTRSMTSEELASYANAVSGTVDVEAIFEDDALVTIGLVKAVVYNNTESGAEVETVESAEVVENATETSAPVTVEMQDLTAADFEIGSGPSVEYMATVTDATELDVATVQANYESLAYICEVL